MPLSLSHRLPIPPIPIEQATFWTLLVSPELGAIFPINIGVIFLQFGFLGSVFGQHAFFVTSLLQHTRLHTQPRQNA